MQDIEKALKRLIHKYSLVRTHSRPLNGEYGYNNILNVDLVEECIRLYEQKKSTIRVLDIGCGNGFALSQLQQEIEEKGLGDHFEFYGLGKNVYDEMFIPKENFIKEGIFTYELNTEPFDLIISVYTFQYLWHKLEALEQIYNSLLTINGQAIIHFPGYLVTFSEDSTDIMQDEVSGNKKFSDYLDEWKITENNPQFEYKMVPYYSDDADRIMLTEFGNLRFSKDSIKKIKFKVFLTGFSIYDDGFILDGLNKRLSYVSSSYNLEMETMPVAPETDVSRLNSNFSKEAPICRITTLTQEFQGKDYHLHLGVHPRQSDVIVGIYPSATEELSGSYLPFHKMAVSIQAENIGAVVRCNGIYDPDVNFKDFNEFFFSQFMGYILKNAKQICGNAEPDIYLMGYSSGGSVIAASGTKYECVKKLLLISPSYDSDKGIIKESINGYTGDVYIVVGDRDQVVLPSQVIWFYHQAKVAKKRKLVEFVCCDHYYNGKHNKETIAKAPLWAFNNSKDFPRGQVMG